MTNVQKHTLISYIKSAIRIIGFILLPFNLWACAGLLVLAEILGIYEEKIVEE